MPLFAGDYHTDDAQDNEDKRPILPPHHAFDHARHHSGHAEKQQERPREQSSLHARARRLRRRLLLRRGMHPPFMRMARRRRIRTRSIGRRSGRGARCACRGLGRHMSGRGVRGMRIAPTGRLRGIGRILRPRLGFARGVAEFERPVRLGMHRLGVHVERRLLLRLERQHDPQQDVCDAQQPTRGQGEHHHDDTDDDRIDVEIIGHARADAAYERLSRTEQPFFTRHASSRSIASTASTHDGEGSSSRSTRTVEMRRRRIA